MVFIFSFFKQEIKNLFIKKSFLIAGPLFLVKWIWFNSLTKFSSSYSEFTKGQTLVKLSQNVSNIFDSFDIRRFFLSFVDEAKWTWGNWTLTQSEPRAIFFCQWTPCIIQTLQRLSLAKLQWSICSHHQQVTVCTIDVDRNGKHKLKKRLNQINARNVASQLFKIQSHSMLTLN